MYEMRSAHDVEYVFSRFDLSSAPPRSTKRLKKRLRTGVAEGRSQEMNVASDDEDL